MNEFVTFFVSVAYLIGGWLVASPLMFMLFRRHIRKTYGSAPWSWWVLVGYSTYIYYVFGVDIYER